MIIEASVRPKNMKRGVSTKSLCQALGFRSEVGLHNLVGKLNLSAEEPGDFGFLLGLYRALSPTGRSKITVELDGKVFCTYSHGGGKDGKESEV